MMQLFESSRQGARIPTPLPEELSLAIAYVPFQQNCDSVSSEEGFKRGTIFPELYKPFTGKRGDLG